VGGFSRFFATVWSFGALHQFVSINQRFFFPLGGVLFYPKVLATRSLWDFFMGSWDRIGTFSLPSAALALPSAEEVFIRLGTNAFQALRLDTMTLVSDRRRDIFAAAMVATLNAYRSPPEDEGAFPSGPIPAIEIYHSLFDAIPCAAWDNACAQLRRHFVQAAWTIYAWASMHDTSALPPSFLPLPSKQALADRLAHKVARLDDRLRSLHPARRLSSPRCFPRLLSEFE
jgi:hypothetical protein